MAKKIIDSIIVDTVSVILNKAYIDDSNSPQGRPGFAQWHQYGTELTEFLFLLQDLGFNIVIVLGNEGTGKTYGIKYLKPGTYLWFNADMKNPTFKPEMTNTEGLNEEEAAEQKAKWLSDFKKYINNKSAPGPLMKVSSGVNPKTGKPQRINFKYMIDVCSKLKAGIKTPEEEFVLSENPVAFLIMHPMLEKKTNGEQRLVARIPGNLANKLGGLSQVEITLVSEIELVNNKPKGMFITQNDGSSSARTPEGMFDDLIIPNDYNFILEKIKKYYNI